MSDEKQYSVWVGSSVVNHYYLTKLEAISMARKFIDHGHDDVFVELVIDKVEEIK
tara:strand:+ start:246 stop:410 length:165 start_codon:yes stop_codon:yes gene_type:complete